MTDQFIRYSLSEDPNPVVFSQISSVGFQGVTEIQGRPYMRTVSRQLYAAELEDAADGVENGIRRMSEDLAAELVKKFGHLKNIEFKIDGQED